MTVKTAISRFQIHDELTAPEASQPVVRTVLSTGGAISKFIGVLAGAPAVLRAYARMRSELRGGALPARTRERIALAVSEARGDSYGVAQHAISARNAGLGVDEIGRARDFGSSDEREAALLAYVRAAVEHPGPPAAHLLEEAREAGWSDPDVIEALGQAGLNLFESLVANAAELPLDRDRPTVLAAAA